MRRLIVTLTVIAIAAGIEDPLEAMVGVSVPDSLEWMIAVLFVWLLVGPSAIEHVIVRSGDEERTLSLGDISPHRTAQAESLGDASGVARRVG